MSSCGEFFSNLGMCMATFLSYICCQCLGRRHKSSLKRGNAAESRTFTNHLSQGNLIGVKIEELGMARGGRPASKAPLTTGGASSANGKKFDEVDLHETLFTKSSDTARTSTTDSEDYFISRRTPVKETNRAIRFEDADGNKIINEYVRECKIGTGSYGKVVLHRSKNDNRLYAIKIFHKSRLRKLRVAPAETAMMDVLREVSIMKKLDHPNIVRLVEVIDDPESDHFYMVLEYVEGGWIFEGSGPPGGIGDDIARRYFEDVVAGLAYLHRNNIVHGDIKPENLLISGEGRVKICDFGVSQIFKDANDELRRSPGTPVYTAPECCIGVTYHGKAADVWALGCTLYCMVLGKYPFVGTSLQSTYEKIVKDEFWYSGDMDPDLLDLLQKLLCKDATQRLTIYEAAQHPWVAKSYPDSFPTSASPTFEMD
ncbi:unnamed protein product [Calypogeia fissa]